MIRAAAKIKNIRLKYVNTFFATIFGIEYWSSDGSLLVCPFFIISLTCKSFSPVSGFAEYLIVFCAVKEAFLFFIYSLSLYK